MKLFRYASIAAVALFIAAPAMAQSDTQLVTMTVETHNDIALGTDPAALVLSYTTPGVRPAPVTGTSTYDVVSNDGKNKDITAQVTSTTTIPADLQLEVQLVAPGAGTSNKIVLTAAQARTAVTGFSDVNVAGLGVTYTLSALQDTLSPGTTTVTVTYTLIDTPTTM